MNVTININDFHSLKASDVKLKKEFEIFCAGAGKKIDTINDLVKRILELATADKEPTESNFSRVLTLYKSLCSLSENLDFTCQRLNTIHERSIANTQVILDFAKELIKSVKNFDSNEKIENLVFSKIPTGFFAQYDVDAPTAQLEEINCNSVIPDLEEGMNFGKNIMDASSTFLGKTAGGLVLLGSALLEGVMRSAEEAQKAEVFSKESKKILKAISQNIKLINQKTSYINKGEEKIEALFTVSNLFFCSYEQFLMDTKTEKNENDESTEKSEEISLNISEQNFPIVLNFINKISNSFRNIAEKQYVDDKKYTDSLFVHSGKPDYLARSTGDDARDAVVLEKRFYRVIKNLPCTLSDAQQTEDKRRAKRGWTMVGTILGIAALVGVAGLLIWLIISHWFISLCIIAIVIYVFKKARS